MKEITKETGKILKFARKSCGLSGKAAAHAIGKNTSTLFRYESGEIPIDIETLYQLSALYNVDLIKALPFSKNTSCCTPCPEAKAPSFYLKYFLGNKKESILSVLKSEDGTGSNEKITLYQDVQDVDNLTCCKDIYYGEIQIHNVSTYIYVSNISNPADQISIILNPSALGDEYQTGIIVGVLEEKGFVPVATKCVISDSLENISADICTAKFCSDEIRDVKRSNHLAAKKDRIRTQMSAAHTKEDLDFAVKCFAEVKKEMNL